MGVAKLFGHKQTFISGSGVVSVYAVTITGWQNLNSFVAIIICQPL